MFVSHCGTCWETPCTCPRYYKGRVPTEYELKQLSVEELKTLIANAQAIIEARDVKVTYSTTTTVDVGRLQNLRASLGHPITTPDED
ncbi:hypothetical protein ST201phi2-1p055 [Pseudomonas phage 201phi2-1]|uniref:Uncharacterized protein n=1 Tax=Pseudomonas phage 201phi2-1 TaxID=198110 RepID=B3FK30_BP201|nr:hypothetical protein ST201phi2-1p055 [Pseudomonas phage 201phi2-1]ABY62888.1 hypothetical protein 201phi2-1p055 [Pseudomonas phage 201phi2-1]